MESSPVAPHYQLPGLRDISGMETPNVQNPHDQSRVTTHDFHMSQVLFEKVTLKAGERSTEPCVTLLPKYVVWS